MQINLHIQPDLDTRESVMFATGRAQFAVTSKASGRTVYIKVEAKKLREGSSAGFVRGTVPFADADRVFVSEKGYGTARIGRIYPNGAFYTDRDERDPHVWALRQIAELASGRRTKDTEISSIEVESTCGLCGLKLEDPVSVARGIGPVCARKPTGTKILHAIGQQLRLRVEAAGQTEDQRREAQERAFDAEMQRRERAEDEAVAAFKSRRDRLALAEAGGFR